MFKEKCYFYNTPLLCNLSCVFCLSDAKKIKWYYSISIKKIIKDFLYIKKLWFKNIVIWWWEPTIIYNLLDIFKVANKLKQKIILITNGQRFADINFLKSIFYTWSLEWIIFSVHHYKHTIHDELVWLNWAFSLLKKAIFNAKKLWISNISTNTAIISYNQENLIDIILYIRNILWLNKTNFCNFEYNFSNISLHKEKLFTNLSLIRKSIDEIIKSWISLNGITFQNLPLCAFPKDRIYLSREYRWKIDYLEKKHIDYILNKSEKIDFRKKYDVCNNCTLNKLCMWVFPYFNKNDLLPFN